MNKKKYYRNQVSRNMEKMWDLEFTKKYLLEVREGIRLEYERQKETLDAYKRRLLKEKYEVFNAEDKSKSDVLLLPITPEEIENLPLEATTGIAFYKKLLPNPDDTICQNMQAGIDKITPDLNQLIEQMKSIDGRIKGPMMDNQGQDHSIEGQMANIMTIVKLLKEHIKSL